MDLPRIPPYVLNFFKKNKINFPENGEVKITPMRGEVTQIVITGVKEPIIIKWGIKNAATLIFKDNVYIGNSLA